VRIIYSLFLFISAFVFVYCIFLYHYMYVFFSFDATILVDKDVYMGIFDHLLLL